MLFGVDAWDIPTLGGVVLIMIGVAIIASLLPALRAARLEPVRILRDE
jgi:ABC-type lipoprotein release transport system permease subunit